MLKSSNGEYVGGGGGGVDASWLPLIASAEGKRGGDGLAAVFSPHACSPLSRSSFSLLHSAVEASFDIKGLWEAVQWCTWYYLFLKVCKCYNFCGIIFRVLSFMLTSNDNIKITLNMFKGK